MTATRVRAPRVRPGTVGRTLLLVVLVGSVLVGLLAMHTIASASEGHRDTASEAAADMTNHTVSGGMIAAPPHAAMPGDCSGMCDTGHIMSSMACVLAVLFTGLVFAVTASRRWSMIVAVLRTRWRAISAVAVATMTPPDLNALSICRT